MVNCKKCGAPLSLDTPKCPYCGEENQEAIEHLKKLKSLEKGYREAQKEVSEEVQRARSSYGPMIILIIVMLANIILLPLHGGSYSFAERINAKKYTKEEINAKLDEMLDEGKYAEFYEFIDHYDLHYSDYSDYYSVFNLAMDYSYICEYLTDYRFSSEYYTDPLVKACEYIKDYQEEHNFTFKRIESEKIRKYAEKLDSEYELLLKTFLNFTDEDIASIEELSDAQLVVLAAGRLNNEE